MFISDYISNAVPGDTHQVLSFFGHCINRVRSARGNNIVLNNSGPELGLGKLGSCPGASTTRGPPQPGGLHNQGSSTYVLSPLIFWYSRVGWVSTAPLLKAAQGPPQPGVLHICLVTSNFLVF